MDKQAGMRVGRQAGQQTSRHALPAGAVIGVGGCSMATYSSASQPCHNKLAHQLTMSRAGQGRAQQFTVGSSQWDMAGRQGITIVQRSTERWRVRPLGVIYELWIGLGLLYFICIRLLFMITACDSCSTHITYVSSCIMHDDSCTVHHNIIRLKPKSLPASMSTYTDIKTAPDYCSDYYCRPVVFGSPGAI